MYQFAGTVGRFSNGAGTIHS